MPQMKLRGWDTIFVKGKQENELLHFSCNAFWHGPLLDGLSFDCLFQISCSMKKCTVFTIFPQLKKKEDSVCIDHDIIYYMCFQAYYMRSREPGAMVLITELPVLL